MASLTPLNLLQITAYFLIVAALALCPKAGFGQQRTNFKQRKAVVRRSSRHCAAVLRYAARRKNLATLLEDLVTSAI